MALINGWVNLEKPEGITSADAVAKVRKILREKKVGHAGTLDPFAVGILPIAIGEGLKTIAYATDMQKEYEFEICFGQQRDTDDITGQVMETSDIRPSLAQIEAILPNFVGEIDQIPPIYSAIKVNGKRAYDMARNGEIFELKPRKVKVESLKILSFDNSKACAKVKIQLVCGKGTYVRSIARDLSNSLGTLGYVSYLRRTRVGKFNSSNSITLAQLDELSKQDPQNFILPVEIGLDDIPAIIINQQDAVDLRHGRLVKKEDLSEKTDNLNLYKSICDDQLIALVTIVDNFLKPVRVFNINK